MPPGKEPTMTGDVKTTSAAETQDVVEQEAMAVPGGRNVFRITAGVLYGVYALFQVFINIYCMQVSLFGIPGALQMEMLFMLGAAGMALWMFSSDKELSSGARRVVVAVTALVVVFELLTYQIQTTLLLSQVASLSAYGTDSFYYALVGFLEKPIWRFVVLLGRMLLLVLAAFFAMNPAMGDGVDEGAENDEGQDGDEGGSDIDAAGAKAKKEKKEKPAGKAEAEKE